MCVDFRTHIHCDIDAIRALSEIVVDDDDGNRVKILRTGVRVYFGFRVFLRVVPNERVCVFMVCVMTAVLSLHSLSEQWNKKTQ